MNIDLTASFKTTFLLEKLTENLETHKKEYEEARKGFKIEVQEQIESLQKLIERKPDTFKVPRDLQRISPPDCHIEEYERVISMLKACTDDELDLDADQYAAYVENKWAWQSGWQVSNSALILKSRVG